MNDISSLVTKFNLETRVSKDEFRPAGGSKRVQGPIYWQLWNELELRKGISREAEGLHDTSIVGPYVPVIRNLGTTKTTHLLQERKGS